MAGYGQRPCFIPGTQVGTWVPPAKKKISEEERKRRDLIKGTVQRVQLIVVSVERSSSKGEARRFF